jgi:hypothetical protein
VVERALLNAKAGRWIGGANHSARLVKRVLRDVGCDMVVKMETGFGIGPIANLAQLPDRFEACGRLQPTEPV